MSDRKVYEIHIGEPFATDIIGGLCKGASAPGFSIEDYLMRAVCKTIYWEMQGAKSEAEVETMVKAYVKIIRK